MPFPARIGVAGNALFPNLTAYAMKLVNRLLPRPTNSSGNQLRSGWESRGSKSTPGWLGHFTDRMAQRNNET
jgi:hypothetical protein